MPADTTVVPGATAEFSVEIFGGTQPIGIQWYVNGTLSTQTGTTLSLPNLTVGASGTTVYAVASNTAGSATSRTATLTVQPSTFYWLDAQAGPGGTVRPIPDGWLYQDGQVVQVLAQGLVGYRFDHWQGVDASLVYANPLPLTMDQDYHIQALFIETGTHGIQYTLTTNVQPAGVGLAIASPSGPFYDAGTSLFVWAWAINPAYVFDHWEGASASIQSPCALTMDGNKTLTAVFRVAGTELIVYNDTLSLGVKPGDPLDLWVDAVGGTPPYQYQWYKGVHPYGAVLGGQTSEHFHLDAVTEAHQGIYYCVVVDAGGAKSLGVPRKK